MATVHVIATGGTIAGTTSDTGTVPTESGRDLLEAYPESVEHVDIELEQLTQTPSSELALDDLVDLAARVRAVAADVDGVVVLHGTDTIEETAYYLDLVLDVNSPVVCTGAQRPHDAISPDGPANVRGALDAASHEHVRSGSYVFFNDRLHAARAVTKRHSSNLAAYGSGNYGPVAERTPEGLWFYRHPDSLSTMIPVRDVTATVEIVATSTDTTGSQIIDAVDRGVDGLVVDGLGLGNVPGAVADAIRTAVGDGIDVVITTRCRDGVVSPVYGADGGAAVLEEAGAMFASNLSAQKARIKLLAALSTRSDRPIRPLFDAALFDGHGYVRSTTGWEDAH
ncbi:asparaginase [Natrialba asiatica]|uniref:L-asparaginase n=1 Tax=Natrialba asiatica (strain ATCC 700177 / DSM 12278 / JCM 9576 / FERM P-10747 / NBRC 102637 / 172P1) TaxID=29540 RepID=M0B571_NATA1|nr:asparaginase [Natrialba asiatica]ELZ06036.1 Asparaginase/glutaminase [Natrialba asiatica DSM 12278]